MAMGFLDYIFLCVSVYNLWCANRKTASASSLFAGTKIKTASRLVDDDNMREMRVCIILLCARSYAAVCPLHTPNHFKLSLQ